MDTAARTCIKGDRATALTSIEVAADKNMTKDFTTSSHSPILIGVGNMTSVTYLLYLQITSKQDTSKIPSQWTRQVQPAVWRSLAGTASKGSEQMSVCAALTVVLVTADTNSTGSARSTGLVRSSKPSKLLNKLTSLDC